jgi:hypothetical protein
MKTATRHDGQLDILIVPSSAQLKQGILPVPNDNKIVEKVIKQKNDLRDAITA